jgi:uncharacterized protein (DUF362 family)/NAD-dependent dihydropyrimidine dehydrogenase PreA subunit
LSTRNPETPASAPSLVSHVTAQHGAGLPAAVERLVAPVGGWQALATAGERIAVKINVLRGAAPARAVSTHPETLRVVLRALKACGAQPFVADSPGGPGATALVRRAYRTSGIAAVCAEEEVELVVADADVTELAAPNGRLFRTFPICRCFVDADAVIQVGVVKTHGLMRLTGGVKLTFGCVPGLSKAHLHVRAQKRADFADMLLDLHLALAPRFTIMDGIIAMEGKGPGSGTPRALDSLFAARDAVALDAALADRTAHARSDLYVLAAAARRGLIDLADPYTLAGDAIVADRDFTPSLSDSDLSFPGRGASLGRRLLTARPRLVNEKACTRCGDCAAICGVTAIKLSPTPVYDDDLCVRCFACTEVCPTAAISEVTPPLMRAVNTLRRKK